MAKVGLKDILLQKGEKIAIGIGAVLLGVLGLMGLMSVVGAESPDQTIKDFKSQASRIQSGVNSDGPDADPLPKWVLATIKSKSIDADNYAAANTVFTPVHQPDTLRDNPQVLGPVQYQIQLVQGPMPSLDIQLNDNGPPSIGVLQSAPKAKKTNREAYEALRGMFEKKKDQPPRTRRGGRRGGNQPGVGGPQGSPGGPGGGRMGPRGGGGGGGMMGPGGPGGGGMMGPGGMPGGEGGEGNPFGMPGMGGPFSGGQRNDVSVTYKTPAEIEKQGLTLAQTITPIKAIMVQFSIPLDQQEKENRRAMRMPAQKGATLVGGPMGGMPGGMPGSPMGGVPGSPMGGVPGSPMGGMPGSPMGGMPGMPWTTSGASYMNNPIPHYDGIEVERRILPAGSKVWSDWTFYDHENEYYTKIRSRKWEDDPIQGQGYLMYFLRPFTERLWTPLPRLAEDLVGWPELTMSTITENIKKLEEAGRPKVTPSDWQKRFEKTSGSDNPFAPVGAGTYGMGGVGGMPGGMPEDGMGLGGARGGRFGPPAPGGSPPGAGGMMEPGMMAGSATPMPEVKFTLGRFLDLDVRPGFSYQYRVRVKMKNPNHMQKDKVSSAAFAKIETLDGPWAELAEIVTIPPEAYVYAAPADEYLKDVDQLYKEHGRTPAIRDVMEYRPVQNGRRAIVQFQTWMSQIRIEGSNKTEPIGTWVSAEMPVAPGEYIGRRQLIELPLWSAAQNAYVLRDLSGGARIAGVSEKNQPRGWPVNFRTMSVLVDFEGGMTKAELADRTVTDESATEVLILQPDGKLMVRNSVDDQQNPERTSRQETWDDWLTRVRERKFAPPTMGDPMDPMMGGGFAPGAGR